MQREVLALACLFYHVAGLSLSFPVCKLSMGVGRCTMSVKQLQLLVCARCPGRASFVRASADTITLTELCTSLLMAIAHKQKNITTVTKPTIPATKHYHHHQTNIITSNLQNNISTIKQQ